jgi:hypothetical protein
LYQIYFGSPKCKTFFYIRSFFVYDNLVLQERIEMKMKKNSLIIALAICLFGIWTTTADAEMITVTPTHIIKDQKDYYLDGNIWYGDHGAVDTNELFSTEDTSSETASSEVETSTTETASLESASIPETTISQPTIVKSRTGSSSSTDTTDTAVNTSESTTENRVESTSVEQLSKIDTTQTTSEQSTSSSTSEAAKEVASHQKAEEPTTTSSTEVVQELTHKTANPSKDTRQTPTLPITGEKVQMKLIYWGIVLICIVSLILVGKLRKTNK